MISEIRFTGVPSDALQRARQCVLFQSTRPGAVAELGRWPTWHRMNDEQNLRPPRVMSANMRVAPNAFKKQECKTLDALVVLHGPPHHKVKQQGFRFALSSRDESAWCTHSRFCVARSVEQAFLYLSPRNSSSFHGSVRGFGSGI